MPAAHVPAHDFFGLPVDKLVGISASQWVFLATNLVICVSYLYIAVRVAPRLPVQMPTLVSAFGFFLFCGMTHFDMVLHTAFERDEPWGEIASAKHMLLVHVPQAFFVIFFARGFFRDLEQLRRTGVPVSPLHGMEHLPGDDTVPDEHLDRR